VSEIFVDTAHWVALQIPKDTLHDTALSLAETIPLGSRIITSEFVLVEFLNYVSKFGERDRLEAAATWIALDANPLATIIPGTSDLLREARVMYAKRKDKSWSLTDCTSFVVMKERKIRDALTYDLHFEQAGFRALLRSKG
jgi:predicted nucleic acid-binding protein